MIDTGEFEDAEVKGIKESKGELNLDYLAQSSKILIDVRKQWDSAKAVATIDINLGKVIDDGLRGYICAGCCKRVTEAHHIKPETFRVIYNGETFYLERHLCEDCAQKERRPAAKLPKSE